MDQLNYISVMKTPVYLLHVNMPLVVDQAHFEQTCNQAKGVVNEGLLRARAIARACVMAQPDNFTIMGGYKALDEFIRLVSDENTMDFA